MRRRNPDPRRPWRWWAACLLWLLTAPLSHAAELEVALVSEALVVDVGGTLTLVVVLRNNTTEALRVDGAADFPTGWRLATSLRDLQLPAAAQRAFPVVVRGDPRAAAGILHGTLRFHGADGTEIIALTVRATVPPRPNLELLLLDAPTVLVDAPRLLEGVVRNLGNVAESVRIEGVGVWVEPSELRLEPGASHPLQVTWGAPAANGESESIRLRLSARGDAGGRAEIDHSLVVLRTDVANGGAWHTLPVLLSLSAHARAGGAAGWAGVRLGLTGAGRWREGSPATLQFSLHSDLPATQPQGWVAWEAPRFGVRFGYGPLPSAQGSPVGDGFAAQLRTHLGAAGHLELSWLRSASRNDLRGTLRWQASLGDLWRTNLMLDAGVRSEFEEDASWRGRAVLQLRHDHLDLSFTASHIPALSGERALDRSVFGARADLDLQGVFALDVAALERFSLRSEVSHVREATLTAEERTLDLDLRLNLRVALHQRLRLSAELAWDMSEITDPGSGWRQLERAWQLNVGGEASFGAAHLSPALDFSLDPATGGLREFGARLRWRGPLGAYGDGLLEGRWLRIRDESDTLVLMGEWGLPLGAEVGRLALIPQLRWRADAPLRANLTLHSRDWVVGGLSLTGRVRVGFDTTGAADWEGGAVLHGRLPLWAGEEVDVRAELKLLEAGWRAEAAARGRVELNAAAELVWEAKALFADEERPSLQVGVHYAHRFALPIGPRHNVGHLTGTLRHLDGTAVAGVGVRVAGRVVATAADGRFHLPNLAVGEHYLSFIPGTMPPGLLLLPNGPTRVTVVAGETADLTLLVVAGASLAGRVVIAPPDPTDVAAVTLVGSGDAATDARRVAGVSIVLRRAATVRRAVSDARGHFHFADLEPGSYVLEVEVVGLPNTLRLGAYPATLEVAAGARLSLDISLEPVSREVRVTDGGVLQLP